MLHNITQSSTVLILNSFISYLFTGAAFFISIFTSTLTLSDDDKLEKDYCVTEVQDKKCLHYKN